MKILKNLLFLSMCAVSFGSLSAYAEVSIEQSGGVKWKAGIDGVEIEWSKNGEVNRIYSTIHQAVEFNDRRGINNGYKIAEIKAKAAIVKFIKQSVSSVETSNEIQTELNKALQSRKSGSDQNVEKTDERTFASSFQETISVVSNGNLSGVVVLAREYSEPMGEVSVTVGVSEKTKHAASKAGDFVSQESSGVKEHNNVKVNSISMPSELQKSRNLDNF